MPRSAHVLGLQPHTPLLHVWLPAHEPQLRDFPQPSSAVPQFSPRSEHDLGLQPHTPSLHVWPCTHEPHSSALPQPSSTVPQDLPSSAHDLGLHSQFPATQCWLEVQVFPQVPQFAESFVVLTHLLPQSMDSGVFRQPSTQVPSLHTGVLPEHLLSHVPQ